MQPDPDRFVWCGHCGLPHENELDTCPFTGRLITDARPSLPPQDPFIGQTLDGKYEVQSLLGKGGMGAVYRALHVQLHKPVAVKVLLGSGRKTIGRLLREGRAAANVQHENVVAVHDVGALDNETPFLVMELLEGTSLDERLADKGQLPLEEALEITKQLLAGLEAVHASGVVHRDVKPANVFLVESGNDSVHVKLLDFSISQLSEASRLTATGEIVGTPAYLSPEQARGESDLDVRVDIWATGVVLYEMLAGDYPFPGDSVSALVTKILIDDPEPITELRPDVPNLVQRVITVALEKEREDRYDSATAMRLALQRARRRMVDTVVDDGEVMPTIEQGVEPTTLVDDQVERDELLETQTKPKRRD